MEISFVIPCFNESRRVDACLEAVTAYLDSRATPGRPAGSAGEVIVVDDGSTDGTADRVRAWSARRADVRLLAHAENAGKGAAARTGVLGSRGEIVVLLDADLAVHPLHVDRILPALRNGVDVALGRRHGPGARVERPQPALRRWLGHAYLGLARRLLGIPASDVTCGFKGFRRRVALGLFRDARCRRWGIDAEILHLAARREHRCLEVPVTWRDGDGSRVRLVADVARSLLELLAVRWRSSRGLYPASGGSDGGPRATT